MTALSLFLAEHEIKAFKIAQLATGHREDALDIVQDTMMKLVQHYADKPVTEWEPLFNRILQHHITDWYRNKHRQRGLFAWFSKTDIDEDEVDFIQSAEDLTMPAADSLLKQRQAIEKLESVLSDLPFRQRQAFLLRCWQGLDTQQSAEAMQCSTGTVKTHYHRALATLRQQLGETWP